MRKFKLIFFPLSCVLALSSPVYSQSVCWDIWWAIQGTHRAIKYTAQQRWDFRDELLKRGYEKVVADKISRDRPDLAERIIRSPRSEPVTVYRGVDKGIEAFNPRHRNTGGRFGGKNFMGDPNSPWVGTEIYETANYVTKTGYAEGIIVKYQIPRFMLRDGADLNKYLSDGETRGQIHWRLLERNQDPFIVQIGILNRQKFHLGDRIEDFVSEWVNYD